MAHKCYVLPEKLATPENTKSYSPVPAFSVRVAQVRAGEHVQKSFPFDPFDHAQGRLRSGQVFFAFAVRHPGD